MRIISSIFNNRPLYGNFKQQKQYYFQRTMSIQKDIITFGAKKPKSTVQKLEELPNECFPSEGLREYLLTEIKKPENKDKGVMDLHKEYYAQLEGCKTLEEAQAIFPEFKKVINLKSTDLSKLRKSNILIAINNGEYGNLTLDNVSLELLKRYTGKLLPVTSGVNQEYFGLTNGAVCSLFDKINLRHDKKYTDIITGERSREHITERWNNEDEREKMLSIMRSEEQIRKCTEASKRYYAKEEARQEASRMSKQRWQDPEYREKMLKIARSDKTRQAQRERQLELWQNAEYRSRMLEILRSEEARQRTSEASKQRWQDPEYREKMLAIIQDEEARERNREIMLALWQDSDFRSQRLESMRTEENIQGCRERMTERWQDPEYREKMAIVNKARTEVWKLHPEYSEVYSKTAEDFPLLKVISYKEKHGIALTKNDINYLRQYFKTCAERYPDIQKIIGEEQKRLLKEQGFYDKE